jgi:RND family efflux transporter MFP subunit
MKAIPLVLGLLLLALAGCGGPKADPTTATAEPAAVPVTVAPVTAVDVPRTVLATGTLHAFDDIMLTPKVDGRVIAVHADVGDRLAPGAPLLDLDPTDHQLAVLEAKRGLDAELAPLGLTALPPGPLDAKTMGEVPSVQVAEVARRNAERKYSLWKNANTSSQGEMLAAELDLKAAEANRKLAVATAESRLAASRLRKAALDAAEQRLADTHLFVPPAPSAAGGAAVKYAVAQRMTSVGEMIRAFPTANVFRLVIDDSLKLRVAVPEKHIPDVAVGQTVGVTVEAYPAATFTGNVSRINPTVDPATRTFGVEIAVPNADGKLKAGGFARAAVRLRTDAIATVPNAALVSFAGVDKVFVADAAKAKAVPVTVGVRDREWVEVIGDLPAGTQVIISGFSRLIDGSPIRVR